MIHDFQREIWRFFISRAASRGIALRDPKVEQTKLDRSHAHALMSGRVAVIVQIGEECIAPRPPASIPSCILGPIPSFPETRVSTAMRVGGIGKCTLPYTHL